MGIAGANTVSIEPNTILVGRGLIQIIAQSSNNTRYRGVGIHVLDREPDWRGSALVVKELTDEFTLKLQGTMVDHYFPTSLHAIWDVLLQSAGGPDSQFFSASLSHKIMTYLLFITFIVAVPVLFSNFLVRFFLLHVFVMHSKNAIIPTQIGEAVGEADAERKKAKLSIIQSKVGYI